MSKNCLMICYYFPPGGGVGVQRSLKFVKYLPELGWQPLVVTADKPLGIPRDERLCKQIPQSNLVYRARPLITMEKCFREDSSFITRFINAALLIPDPILPWVPSATRLARHLAERKKVSVIYSTSPPNSTHLAAGLLKYKSGLPWVADFRDAWLADPDRNRSLHNRLRSATLEKWQERWVVRKADRIVTVSEPIKLDFLERYPDLSPNKVVVIPNGYDPDDFLGLIRRPNNKFTFTFTGSLSKQHREATPLLKAASQLRKNHPSFADRFQIIFVGPYTKKQEALCTQMGLAGVVKFLGFLPHRKALLQQLKADVNVILYNGPKDERSLQMMSGKIFEYLGAGRPILAICTPGTAIGDLLSKLNTGVVVPPDASQEIVQAMVDLMKGKATGMGTSPEHLQFHRRYLTRKLVDIFEELGDQGIDR